MKNFVLILKSFKKGMVTFGKIINVLVTTVLLVVVYFFGIGITSLIARAKGKKFLDIKTDANTSSYWAALDLKKKPLKDYYHQF